MLHGWWQRSAHVVRADANQVLTQFGQRILARLGLAGKASATRRLGSGKLLVAEQCVVVHEVPVEVGTSERPRWVASSEALQILAHGGMISN